MHEIVYCNKLTVDAHYRPKGYVKKEWHIEPRSQAIHEDTISAKANSIASDTSTSLSLLKCPLRCWRPVLYRGGEEAKTQCASRAQTFLIVVSFAVSDKRTSWRLRRTKSFRPPRPSCLAVRCIWSPSGCRRPFSMHLPERGTRTSTRQAKTSQVLDNSQPYVSQGPQCVCHRLSSFSLCLRASY